MTYNVQVEMSFHMAQSELCLSTLPCKRSTHSPAEVIISGLDTILDGLGEVADKLRVSDNVWQNMDGCIKRCFCSIVTVIHSIVSLIRHILWRKNITTTHTYTQTHAHSHTQTFFIARDLKYYFINKLG